MVVREKGGLKTFLVLSCSFSLDFVEHFQALRNHGEIKREHPVVKLLDGIGRLLFWGTSLKVGARQQQPLHPPLALQEGEEQALLLQPVQRYQPAGPQQCLMNSLIFLHQSHLQEASVLILSEHRLSFL
jgi:hypothetical protein